MPKQQVLTYVFLALALTVGMGVLFRVYGGPRVTAETASPSLDTESSVVSVSNFTPTPPYKATVAINLKDNRGNPLDCQSPAPKAVNVEILPTRSFDALNTQITNVSHSADCNSNWVVEIESPSLTNLPFLVKVLDEKENISALKKEVQIGIP